MSLGLRYIDRLFKVAAWGDRKDLPMIGFDGIEEIAVRDQAIKDSVRLEIRNVGVGRGMGLYK